MHKRYCMLVMCVVAAALVRTWAQDTPIPEGTVSSSPQQPVPAYGQENAPPPITENPPLSGLDLPSLEPHAAPLSYLQPGATFSETADTNLGNNVGGSKFGSITRGLGSLALKRVWSHYDLALDYVGGIGYYNTRGIGRKWMQDAGFEQKITWKRGEFSVRDTFSYLPEGNFGSAYGSLGSSGIVTVGNTAFGSFFGGSALGSLGVVSRLSNVAMAGVTENLSPKTAITAASGYAFTHFYGNGATGGNFIGSSQVSAQGGYSRILTSHTQVGLLYGYQGFDFSVLGTAFHTDVIQGMYGRRISGRMDLRVGAGPQFTFINTTSFACNNPAIPPFICTLFGYKLVPVTDSNTKIGVAAQARLRYKFPRTNLDVRYERYETSGSGIFAGAQSDIVRVVAERPLSRVWTASVDIGYSHNSRVQPLSQQQITSCEPQNGNTGNCPAKDAKAYSYYFLGGVIHRHFGRNFHAFLSYQDNELSFDQSYCTAQSPCNRMSNRQVITLGLDWVPRPIRID